MADSAGTGFQLFYNLTLAWQRDKLNMIYRFSSISIEIHGVLEYWCFSYFTDDTKDTVDTDNTKLTDNTKHGNADDIYDNSGKNVGVYSYQG